MQRQCRSAIVFLISILISTGGLFAQSSWDLFDPVYEDLEAWELAGIISELPWLKPYPPQMIRDRLELVAAGDGPEAVIAAEYLEELPDPVDLSPAYAQTVRIDEAGNFYGEGSPSIGFAYAGNGLSADGLYSPNLIDNPDGLLLPPLERNRKDWIPDWSDFELFGRSIDIRQSLDSNAAVHMGEWWFQTGLGRSSYGPFTDDGAVLSPNAPRAGRFSLTWETDPLTFQLLQLELSATNDTGGGRYPDKRMVFHSFQWRITPWAQVGLYESVVYGDRFEPRYLIPFSILYLSQGLGGFFDNSLLGLTLELKPTPWLRIPVTVYADDVHFNDIVRFDFETKYKLSAQAGIKANPPWVDWVDQVSIDYLAVMPYMYSHKDQDATVPNYSNYTHFGTNLGPSVDPNSDRVALRLSGRPVRGMRAWMTIQHVRHGNPSVGFTDGDGSIFDDGYDGNTPTFQTETRFLEQDMLERTFSACARVEYTTGIGPLRLDAGVGYTFSRIANAELVEGAIDTGHVIELFATVAY